MRHPLLAVVDQITADATYTTTDLAHLLRMHRSSINSLAQGGWFPGGQHRPHTRGGRQRVWTGTELLAAAHLDEDQLPTLDHARLAPSTLWRMGCGCDDCLDWHNETTRERRRRIAAGAFPAQVRRRVLDEVAAGVPVPEAAKAAGVTVGQVWGCYRVHTDFARLLDEAGEALCQSPGDSRCGTPAGYAGLSCRGTACRIAKRAEREPTAARQS